MWNAERRFQGQSDCPLDETGRAQADRAARLLAALGPDLIISSDLSRAASTAAPLARLTGLTVILDKDLRERHGGCWEGLTDTEIRERYPDAHATWTPPDGEPSAAVADRVAAALRLGMSRVLGLPDELSGVLGPLSNCSWSVLSFRYGRWRLQEHNAGTLPEPVLSDDR